ncbi:metallophosphoesterase family protein [Sphingomonas profundi]|uniref:metallophosphoesterase family protein n=1 Tax=Alterirhizorhabdus profundi TaxID=2681549 RepID=UPI0012E818BE|nr:metallophosphoesterase family protein [Sphingomonas profundi]
MRLAVLSDIHGNLPALEAVIANARARGADAFVNLGDSVSGPLWPRETAALLMALGWPTLAGNQDRQVVQEHLATMGASDRFARERLGPAQLAWLATLPSTLEYAADIFLCHGTPASDSAYLLEDVGEDGAYPAAPGAVAERLAGRRERLTLCGHSHLARLLWLADGRTVANPGSVGLPAYADPLPHWHVMESGTPRARYALVEDGAVDLLEADYDFAAASAKARAEGRGDWSFALATGRAR